MDPTGQVHQDREAGVPWVTVEVTTILVVRYVNFYQTGVAACKQSQEKCVGPTQYSSGRILATRERRSRRLS